MMGAGGRRPSRETNCPSFAQPERKVLAILGRKWNLSKSSCSAIRVEMTVSWRNLCKLLSGPTVPKAEQMSAHSPRAGRPPSMSAPPSCFDSADPLVQSCYGRGNCTNSSAVWACACEGRYEPSTFCSLTPPQMLGFADAVIYSVLFSISPIGFKHLWLQLNWSGTSGKGVRKSRGVTAAPRFPAAASPLCSVRDSLWKP